MTLLTRAARTIAPARLPEAHRVLRLAVLAGFCALGLAAGVPVLVSRAWAATPSDAGGVLVLHMEDEALYEYGTFDHCGDLRLTDPKNVRARIPGDGLPHLVGVYAVFPEDSVGAVKVFSFGIRYSAGVRIVGQGPCNAGGMTVALNGWPAPYGGLSVHIMPEGVKTARIIPLYWFALQCKGQGAFETIPHPVPKIAGRFVTIEVPYLQEAITGYGRVGFEQDGFVPPTGTRPVIGPCCVDECRQLTKEECALYGGVFLGQGMTCDHEPCREEAFLGACCLPSGCEMLTLVKCARDGGVPLGEGVECGAMPCPAPADTESK